MPKKKTYDAFFIQRGRVWYGWTNEPAGATAQGRTKQEARERLMRVLAAILYPGSKGATSKTVDFQIKERLVIERRSS
jgi:hypothetical protein